MIELCLVRHAQPEWEPGGRAVDDPSLSELGRRHLGRLSKLMVPRQFRAGEVIIKENDQAAGFFVIECGKMSETWIVTDSLGRLMTSGEITAEELASITAAATPTP